MASMSGVRVGINDFFTNKVPAGASIAANWVKANPRLTAISVLGVSLTSAVGIARAKGLSFKDMKEVVCYRPVSFLKGIGKKIGLVKSESKQQIPVAVQIQNELDRIEKEIKKILGELNIKDDKTEENRAFNELKQLFEKIAGREEVTKDDLDKVMMGFGNFIEKFQKNQTKLNEQQVKLNELNKELDDIFKKIK